MSTMTKGNAAGLNDINVEMLQALEGYGLDKTTDFCNNMYQVN